MKSRGVGPPDGGYGWVVVTSAFFVMGLTGAPLKNFGLFFLDIQSHFGVLTSTTSWVSSTTIAMFHIGGTGISFSWIPAISMVNHYFSRWRPLAYAIASSGECVFAIVFSPLFKWLIETYSWQGALLIIGGLQFNLCVCGALMRPLEANRRALQINGEEGVKDSAATLPSKKKAVFQCCLLKKTEFLFYILSAVFAAAGFFVPTLFLVPFANSLGIEEYWPAFILSVMAVADLAGRLSCGWLANMRYLRNLQLLTAVTTLLGVVLLLLPISYDYWSVLVFASLYGFLFGCMVAIHVTSIVDIVSLDGFDSGLGLFMLFRSIGGFIGPPAGGWLVDQTNDYSAAFYLSGSCLITSAMFVVLVDRLVQRRKAAEESGNRTIKYRDEGAH